MGDYSEFQSSRPQLTAAVLLNDFCAVQGGASRVAIDEAVALAEQGIEVTFLGAAGPIGPELRDSRVRTVCLHQPQLAEVASHPRVALQGLWNAVAGRRMREILSHHDPAHTIVHLHGYTKALTTSPLRAAAAAGFPIVATLHDFFAMCPNGNYYDYVREAPCTLRPLSGRCIATNCDKRRYLHKLYRVSRGAVQRWVGLMPSCIGDFIALSERSAAILRPYLAADARIHPLANIIDTPRLAPADVATNTELVFVGRLDPEKGVRVLLEAAERVGASVTFVGDGPLRGEVEATGCHRATGWQDAAGVRAHLRRARCLVFPSQWHETFGVVVSEAAANGIPAIVSDVSGAAERVRHRESGLVFPSGDVAMLAQWLAATADGPWMSKLGRAAYEDFWSAPPTPERHVAGLIRIYECALASAAERLPRLGIVG